jgi:hypothetical protein
MARQPTSATWRDLRPGQAISIARYAPYWEVCEVKTDRGTRAYIVVDTAAVPDHKPVKVYGPTTRADAIEWARMTSLLFLSTHGGVPGLD